LQILLRYLTAAGRTCIGSVCGKEVRSLRTRLIVLWVFLTAATLSALPFVIAALTAHHATRSAGDGRGFHDGEI